MVVFSIITSLIIAIQDPIIQKFAVRIAGGWLSEKTGADIKIGKLYVSPDFAIHIEGITVKDLKNNDIANIGDLKAKIFIEDILNGDIHVGAIELRDSEVKLVKYAGEDDFNFKFIADAFKTDKPKDSTSVAPIRIDHVVLEHFDFLLWDQDKSNRKKRPDNAMDYSHLDIDDIHLEAKGVNIMGDSVVAVIDALSAEEKSGFQIKRFQGNANVSPQGILVDGLRIQTKNSHLDLDLHMLFNGFDDIRHFVDSVRFDSKIRTTDIMLSDIGPFAPVLYKMPNRVLFECLFAGPIRHFNIDELKAEFGEDTYFECDMSMHPLDFFNGYHTLNISKMHYSYADLVGFHIPGKTVTIPLPESLRGMNQGEILFDFKGSYRDFVAEAHVTSDLGNVAVSFNMGNKAENADFEGQVNANSLDIGAIANASNIIGTIDINSKISGHGKRFKDLSLDIEGDAYNAHLLENTIDKIKLNGNYGSKQFVGLVSIKDSELDLDFNGLVNFANPEAPFGDFSAAIAKADLKGLNILKNDSTAIISTNITANMVGFDIDKMEGTLSIENTQFLYGSEHYEMKHFDANVSNDNLMHRRFNVNCDFFNYEMAGLIDFASMADAFKNLFDQYADIPKWDQDIERYLGQKDIKEQDFFVNLSLTHPRPLLKIFMPALYLAPNTTLNGTFTSRTNMLNMTLRSKKAKFNKIQADDIECKLLTTPRKALTQLNISDIVLRDSTERNPNKIALEHFKLENWFQNDSIFSRVRWDDMKNVERNKADIMTVFLPNEEGGLFNISSAEVIIYDSVWTIAKDNLIRFNGKHIDIENLKIQNNEQHFRADGFLPFSENDTLLVNFEKFDVSDFDFLLNGIDLDGYINGDVALSNLKGNPYILANLAVNRFSLNKEHLGDINIDSHWDSESKSIYLNASLYEGTRPVVNLSGNYGTKTLDKLNFDISLDGLRLNVIEPFTQGILSRVQGKGKGTLTVKGSTKKPIIEGGIDIEDGGCKIDYLKTFYTFNPSIHITEDLISLDNLVLQDTLGNTAKVIGKIQHKHLKDFRFDITLLPKNFIAMQTSAKDSPSYFGTAVADGSIKISGPMSDIGLSIKALTRKGTKITIPFNASSSVKKNDFITFVDHNKTDTEEDTEARQHTKKKTKNRFSLDLDMEVTPDASIKIILPKEIGTIDAVGDGDLQIGVNSSGDFFLIGDYDIENGKFILKYKDILSKTLKLQKGGRISWTGDPKRGTINVTGIYSTNAAMGSLGVFDIDTTAASNKINVNCLIHLSGQLLNPNITFSIRFPNASEDLKQTLYAELDTTNQAAMTQQAVSLLILNAFTSVNSSTSYSNNSDYFDIITSQFTNWISQLSENFDMGVHYRPRNGYTNEEIQIALKTQLFENRLTIETNFGMISQNNPGPNNKVSNIIGEVDVYYKISKDGKLQAHFYNHSNSNNYFYLFSYDELAPYTQGLGLSYSNSFSKFRDIFRKKPAIINEKPLIEKKTIEKQ